MSFDLPNLGGGEDPGERGALSQPAGPFIVTDEKTAQFLKRESVQNLLPLVDGTECRIVFLSLLFPTLQIGLGDFKQLGLRTKPLANPRMQGQ